MSIAMTVTNNGHNMFRSSTSGNANPKFFYVAIGSGTTAPTVTDTQLQAETFRKAITSYVNGASVGEILISCYLAPSDAIGANIQEIGVFADSFASSTPNSGTLFARALWSHPTKTATESIILQLDAIF